MTSNIKEIVNVQITREIASVSQEGFGTMMILGDNAVFAERLRYYASADEVLADFASTDGEYKAAVAAFSQDIKVERVAVGRRETPQAQVQILDFSADFISGNIINLEVDGVAISPITFLTDHATTIGLLETALEAFDSIGAVVVTGNNLSITAAIDGVPVSITNIVVTGGVSQPTHTLTTTTENIGVAEDLAAISEEDDDWYALVMTSTTKEEQLVAAKYIEAKRKIYALRTSEADVLTNATDDIGSLIKAKGYDRTFVIYNATTDDYIDAAWLGKVLPYTPGSATWKFKTLNSITADNLTTDQKTNAQAKNVNVYRTIGGVDITAEGVVGSGEFIDIIHGIDLLTARIEESVYGRLQSSLKIPYTDGGIAILENDVRGVLAQFVGFGLLADNPAPTVVSPKALDVPSVDRAARFLGGGGIKFDARLAGAIHKADIVGKVTV